MFDALSFPRSRSADAAPSDALGMPIAIKPGDRARFLGYGTVSHLNRPRRCGWHLVVHRAADGTSWTHLYKTLAEHGGRVLVLLHAAKEGALEGASEGTWEEGWEGGGIDIPASFSPLPLPVEAQGCEVE